ncbi:hypothetical protein [Streptomyces sp. NPDC046862]|uniref:hypothetical protein n=1 Tax=Streptomyces sp. NPDC046862 TaxID=3154603 RepID=UPI00345323AA
MLPEGTRHVLPDLLEEIRSALGDQLVGVYPYGSAVAGDFAAGHCVTRLAAPFETRDAGMGSELAAVW